MAKRNKIDLDTRRQTCTRVSRADIASGLRDLGIDRGDVVFVHSSLSTFGYVEGGADTVIDALLDVLGPDGTLAMPTFTWGEFHDKIGIVFDVANTPCETGRIPETFRKRPGVIRSGHICHSVAACGPHAEEILGDGVSSFGKGSPFDALYRLNAWNLLLGVGFSSCTALHSAEERVQVPYRAYRDFRRSKIVWPDGKVEPSRAVEYLRQDGSANDFDKMYDVLERAGVLRVRRIGEARCINVRIRDVIDHAVGLLKRDPYFLSRYPGGPSRRRAQHRCTGGDTD